TRSDEAEAALCARIASLGDGTGYRVAQVEREQALRVAQSAGADPDARVGACALLRGAMTSHERRVLYEARSETAHPRVRVALAALDEEDEDDEAQERAATGR